MLNHAIVLASSTIWMVKDLDLDGLALAPGRMAPWPMTEVVMEGRAAALSDMLENDRYQFPEFEPIKTQLRAILRDGQDASPRIPRMEIGEEVYTHAPGFGDVTVEKLGPCPQCGREQVRITEVNAPDELGAEILAGEQWCHCPRFLGTEEW